MDCIMGWLLVPESQTQVSKTNIVLGYDNGFGLFRKAEKSITPKLTCSYGKAQLELVKYVNL